MSGRMTPEQLRGIKARAAKARPGPWRWTTYEETHIPGRGYVISHRVLCDDEAGEYVLPIGFGMRQEEAEFIASAREDIPALVAEVERLRQEVSRMEHFLDRERFERFFPEDEQE